VFGLVAVLLINTLSFGCLVAEDLMSPGVAGVCCCFTVIPPPPLHPPVKSDHKSLA
jgi:hypothetical protein